MMDITMREVESVYLLAMSRFERWRQKFESKFYSDIVESQVAIGKHFINSLPEEVKAESKMRQPEAWKMIEGNNKEV